jgi:peptide/nickel transport system substrate-binding protein
MKKFVLKLVAIVSIIGVLMLVACSNNSEQVSDSNEDSNEQSEDNSSSKSGEKTMYLGMVNPPVHFNTINTSDVASSLLEGFMFDSFLDMDGPLNFVPKLADSFTTEDNQTFIIKINEKANWTDGTPVTADDVIFTLNLAANPKVETAIGGYISMLVGLDSNGKLPEGETEIPSLKKIDDKTLQFTTKTPVDPNMIKEQLGVQFMTLPKHIIEQIDPAQLTQDPFFQNPTVTNGAFKFIEYKKDAYAAYVANPDYYRGAPELDRLYVKLMPAPNLTAQLQTGDIHMNVASGVGKIPIQDYDTVRGFEHVRTKEEPTIGYQTMQFNTKTIKDPKVRQAIVYALDRQLLVNNLLKGSGEVVDGPYTSVSPYLNKNLEQFKHDPEKARQMLEEAGWDFDRTLRLVVPIGNKVREQSAPIIAQNLKQVGIKVEITNYDFPTIMQKGKAGEFDLLLIGFTFTLDPDVSRLYGPEAPFNFMSYENSKMNELLQNGKSEANQDTRREIYNELQKIWNEDMPIITLYSDYDFSGISKFVTHGEPKVFGMQADLQKWNISGAQ